MGSPVAASMPHHPIDMAELEIRPVQPIDDDAHSEKEIKPVHDETTLDAEDRHALSAQAEAAGIATEADFDLVVDQMMTLSAESAMEILLDVITVHEGECTRLCG